MPPRIAQRLVGFRADVADIKQWKAEAEEAGITLAKWINLKLKLPTKVTPVKMEAAR
jgi:hypothetical protein